jgi:hypothetical protein
MVVSSSVPSMPVPSMPFDAASCAEWPSRDDKRNADPTTPLRSIEKHSTMGPRHRRSLRSGRDDKGKGNGCIESGCRTEAFLILDPDDADLFWKNVRTKYPLTQARPGEHKPPRSELEGEETGRLRH